jgi:hypothetical protein
MNSLRVLLEGAIDYAGLFPPASLTMPEAIRNYAAYLESEDSWALGRFIVPLARLGEVAGKRWRFSVLAAAGEEIPGDVVEIKAIAAAEIRVPQGATAYFEAPEELIPTIAAAGGRAKIRMGGSSVPDSRDVARFMLRCVHARIGFKATAGLHHPVRSSEMHGFLNTLMAACLVWHGAAESLAQDVLEDTSPESFHFDDDGAAWRDRRLTVAQIADARKNFIAGFGSCSFEEPTQDLRDLGLLCFL